MLTDYRFPATSPATSRKRPSWDAILQFSGAVLVILQQALDWAHRIPYGSKILFGMAIFVILWIAARQLAVLFHWVIDRLRTNSFVEQQDVRMHTLLDRFNELASSNQTCALMQIIRSAMGNNVDSVARIVACDYIGNWITCFRLQLESRTSSMPILVKRSHELTSLVSSFNRDYAQRAQRQLSAEKDLAEHSINELEEFREEFNALLRDLEEWGKEIFKQQSAMYGQDGQTLWPTPGIYFERVKSFRRSANAAQ